MEQTLFFAGVPTEPDVNKLRDQWPDPAAVGLIGYDAVESVLGLSRNSHRYATVTDAWRKQHESETGQVIGCERGRGFRVLTPLETLDTGVDKLRHAARSVRRGGELASKVDRAELTPENRARADHAVRASASILGAMRTAAKPLGATIKAMLTSQEANQ